MVAQSIRYINSGLSVVPTKGKRPMFAWKAYQYQAPSIQQALQWWNGYPSRGIAIICGVGSGGLAVLDFDNKEAYREMSMFLLDICPDMPIIKTPNGYHVYFRCNDLVKTTKLAMNNDGVIVEFKGVGGYVVAPPTPRYVVTSGDITKLPTLSKEQVSKIVLEARTLDERPPVEITLTKNGRGVGKTIQTTNVEAYVAEKMEEIREGVSNAGKGNRNNSLFAYAAWAGEFVGGGYVTLDDALILLYDAATLSGLTSDKNDGRKQTNKTIKWGLRKGMKKPIFLETDDLLDGIPA